VSYTGGVKMKIINIAVYNEVSENRQSVAGSKAVNGSGGNG